MAHRSDSTDKVPISSFSYGDWLAAGVALAIAGPLVLALMFLLFWLAGMPGPMLWFGSCNVPADILEVTLAAAAMTLFCNTFGAMLAVSFFWALRKRRR